MRWLLDKLFKKRDAQKVPVYTFFQVCAEGYIVHTYKWGDDYFFVLPSGVLMIERKDGTKKFYSPSYWKEIHIDNKG